MKKTLLVATAIACALLFASCNEKKNKDLSSFSGDLKDVGKGIVTAAKDTKKSVASDKAKEKAVSNEIDIKNLDIASLPENPASDFEYAMYSEDTVSIRKYKKYGDNTASPILVIPKEIEGFPVVSVNIRGEGLYGGDGLLSLESAEYPLGVNSESPIKVLVIPEGVEHVYYARSFVNLEYISLPRHSLKELLDLSGCGKLSKIDFPDNVTVINKGIFANTGFDSINLPPTLKYIGKNAFTGSKLTSIVIPDSVKEIWDDAFKECKSLKSVTLPKSAEILAGAFRDCSSLEEVIIPEGCSCTFPYGGSTQFSGTKLSLKTQSELIKLGYNGSF